MDIDKITYWPYRTHIFFAPIMTGIGVISLVVSGMFLSETILIDFLIVLSEGLLCVGAAYYLHNSSKAMLVFESGGLRIINDGRIKYCYIPWDKLSFGYYGRSYKRHEFLVLSPESLSKEQLKKLINRGANTTKICIGNVIVIYLDGLQDTLQIKGMIEEKVSSVVGE